jgi:hypothetical protein
MVLYHHFCITNCYIITFEICRYCLKVFTLKKPSFLHYKLLHHYLQDMQMLSEGVYTQEALEA